MLKQFKPCTNQPISRLLLVALMLIGFLAIYTADANPPVATSGGKSLFAPDANQKVSTDVHNSAIPTKRGVSNNASSSTTSSETYSTAKLNVKRTADDGWEAAYYRFLQEHRVRPKLIRARYVDSFGEIPKIWSRLFRSSALRCGQARYSLGCMKHWHWQCK